MRRSRLAIAVRAVPLDPRLLKKPHSVVSSYESGKRRLDLVEFLLIARILGADPVKIFTKILRSLPK
jgi:hypothetical protein